MKHALFIFLGTLVGLSSLWLAFWLLHLTFDDGDLKEWWAFPMMITMVFIIAYGTLTGIKIARRGRR